MKFIIKDKKQKIQEGYKEVDIPVLETGLATSIIPITVCNFPHAFSPTMVHVCTNIMKSITTLGNLPFTTIAGGTIVFIGTAIIASELGELITTKAKQKDQFTKDIEEKITQILKQRAMTKKFAPTIYKEDKK